MTINFEPPQILENYDPYLKYIADLNVSTKEKYELLHIVSGILSYFVDRAFHVDTDQITLRAAAESRNNLGRQLAGLDLPKTGSTHANTGGVADDSNAAGSNEP